MATRTPENSTAAIFNQLVSIPPQSEGYPTPDTLTSLRPKKAPIQLSVDGQVLWEREVPIQTRELAKRMLSFCYLQPGWDSREAKPTDINCVITAINIISETFAEETPLPHVVPTVGGGVQIEWHLANADAEIEIVNPFTISLYFTNNQGDEIERELNLDNALAEIVTVLDKLSV